MTRQPEARSKNSAELLETIEVRTGSDPTGTVIRMHGLGADGRDFEPIVPQLVHRGERALRFVFPHAPVRPVTINSGHAMRAWYDTRYPGGLAGIMGLSCYMLLASTFDAERPPANQVTPIFMAHGADDPIMPIALGDATHHLLAAASYAVEWHSFRMPHSVCPEEIVHIAAWLRKVL